MKTKNNYLTTFTLVGTALFSYLFWEEDLALNLLIYSLFIISVTLLNKEVTKGSKFIIYSLAHLITAIAVVLYNSDLSIISYYISLFIFVGFCHFPKIKTVFMALIAFVFQMLLGVYNFIKRLNVIDFSKINNKPVVRLLKYIVLPVLIVGIFVILYSNANDIFAHYVSAFFTSISDFIRNIFNFLFKNISLRRVFHILLGFIITAGLLISTNYKKIETIEQDTPENLNRIKNKTRSKTILNEVIEIFTGPITKRITALKTENIIALISFIALNILLLSINLIDITTLWFGYKPSANFSADLHQGTNALIFSIVLAMAVILYFFRGNLNFYNKSKSLKFLAYCWMIQNFILIISVFIRDGYYIDHFGLTHKRIGVLVFAILCLFGLTSVYFKVAKQKTLFFLIKINGNIWLALLVTFSLVDWDVLIARYNFSQSDKIEFDPSYQLSLSNRALVILYQNRDKLFSKNENNESLKNIRSNYSEERFNERILTFKARYQNNNWQSWNLTDYNNAMYFNTNK